MTTFGDLLDEMFYLIPKLLLLKNQRRIIDSIILITIDVTHGKYNVKLSFLISISPGSFGSDPPLGRKL